MWSEYSKQQNDIACTFFMSLDCENQLNSYHDTIQCETIWASYDDTIHKITSLLHVYGYF